MNFTTPDLLQLLAALDDQGLNQLEFGVIGFDAAGLVTVYNEAESRATGLRREELLGRPLFTEVAQCMNNYLVALKFDEAAESGQPLDLTLPYVLSWRMKPEKVKLRLLSAPGLPTRYLVFGRT